MQCSDPDGGVAVAPRRETRPPQGAIAGAAADRADGQREAVISRLAGENERSGLPCDRRYAGLVPSVLILYVLWVAITYVLDGFPKTLLRPEAQALRTTYLSAPTSSLARSAPCSARKPEAAAFAEDGLGDTPAGAAATAAGSTRSHISILLAGVLTRFLPSDESQDSRQVVCRDRALAPPSSAGIRTVLRSLRIAVWGADATPSRY